MHLPGRLHGKSGAVWLPALECGTSKASRAFWQVSDIEKEVTDRKSRGVSFEDYDMPGMALIQSA